MKTVKGNKLSPAMQQQARNMFVHRYTGEHKPRWADNPWKDGKAYPVQFRNDQEWLANTEFYITTKGQFSRRHLYCHSVATWPNNPELRTKN